MSSEQQTKRDQIWENITALSDRTSRMVFADLLSRKCYSTLIYSCLQNSDPLISTNITKATLEYLKTTEHPATRLVAIPIDDTEQWQKLLLLSLKTKYFDLSAKIIQKSYEIFRPEGDRPQSNKVLNIDIAQLIFLSNDMALTNYFLTLPDADSWVKHFPISEITQGHKFLDHARHPKISTKLFIKSKHPDSWLTAAIRDSNTQLVHLLLQYPKIKESLFNKNGDADLPPLLLALRDADEKTIDYCLKAYHPTSRLNLYNENLKPISAPNGETLLTYYLKVASNHGALLAVKTIAKIEPELIFKPNSRNETPLMLFFTDPNLISIFMHDTSIRSEYSEILHRYSHLFSKNINIADKNLNSIMFHALQLYGTRVTGAPVVQLLMSLGASIDYKSANFMALNGHYDNFLITYIEKYNFNPPSEITLSLISANNMDLLSRLNPKSFYEPIPTDPLLHKINTLLTKDNSKNSTIYFLVHQFLSAQSDNILTLALRKISLYPDSNSLQKITAEHPLLISKKGSFGNSALQLALRKKVNEKIIIYILLNTSPNKTPSSFLISDNGETPLTEIAKLGLKKKLRIVSRNWTSILMQKSILYYLYINGFENPNKDPVTEQNFAALSSAIRNIWSNESNDENDPDILFWIQFRRLYLETLSLKEYHYNILQITNNLPLSLANKYFPEQLPMQQEALLHAIEHMIKKQYSIINQNRLNVIQHINHIDKNGKTPLDHALENQNWDIANILICRLGANKVGPGLIELMINRKTNLLKKSLKDCDVTIELPLNQEVSNKIIIELLSNKQLPYIHWLITSHFISNPSSLELAELFPSFWHSTKISNYKKLAIWQKTDSYLSKSNSVALREFYTQNETILRKQVLLTLKFSTMLDKHKFFFNWMLNKFSFIIAKDNELIYSIFRFCSISLINRFLEIIPNKLSSKRINHISRFHRDFLKIHDHKIWLFTKSDKVNLNEIYENIANRLYRCDETQTRYLDWMKESLNTAIEIGNLELLKTILNQIMQISFYLKKDAKKLMQVKNVFQPILKSQDETSVIIDAKQMISDRLIEL